MTQYLIRIALAFAPIAAPASETLEAADMSLESLRRERKFAPTELYTGPDTPEDGPELVALVNSTIDDVIAMQRPLAADAVRSRLQELIDDVDLFATEDRDQTYVYAIRIWRAAGFTEESGLFPVGDESVLRSPW